MASMKFAITFLIFSFILSMTFVAAESPPIGLIDPINGPAIIGQGWGVDNIIHGWACDPDWQAQGQSISVHLYIDQPAGPGQVPIVGLVANENSEPAVAEACGSSNTNQRFAWSIPQQYWDGQQHQIYAYAIGKNSAGQDDTINAIAVQSPQSFTIQPVAPVSSAPIGLIDPINGPAIPGLGFGVDNIIHGWACDPDWQAQGQSISVHLYIDQPAGPGQTPFAGIVANQPSEPQVAEACDSSNSNQRFSFAIPQQYWDGNTHQVYAYAIGKNSAGQDDTINAIAVQSPQSFNIAPPHVDPSITSFQAPSSATQGNNFTVSGSASAGSSCITAHRFFVVGSQGGVWTPISCVNSVSFSSSVNSSQNNRSFYHGTGSYTLRYEVQAQDGTLVAQDRSFQVNAAPVIPSTPSTATISSFTVSPPAVTEGDNLNVQGSASAGSSCITAHRFFVVGSQGGVWTNVSCVQSVTLSDSVPTDQNPLSFYQGAGSYTLRWEVQNALGQSTIQDRPLLVLEADDGSGNGDTTPPAPVTGLVTGTVNATSITISWTNPSTSDFMDTLIYLNNNLNATTSGNTYTINGLAANTSYTVTLYTRDTSGNINSAGVSVTATTLPAIANTTTPPINNTNTSTSDDNNGGSSGGGSSSGGTRRGTSSITQDPSPIILTGTADPIYISNDADRDSDSNSRRFSSIFASMPSLFSSPVFLMLILIGVLLLAALVGLLRLHPTTSSRPARIRSRTYGE